MAKGAAPSQDQLLELMKRAADELRHAQEEARTAVLALQKEQAAHRKTEAELEQALKAAQGAKGLSSADEQLLRDQIEAERENGKALAERVKELETAVSGAQSERESLQVKVNEAETALSVASQQEEARTQKLKQELLDAQQKAQQAAQSAADEREQAIAQLTADHQQQVERMRAEHEKALEEARRALEEAESSQRAMLEDAANKLVLAEQQYTQERDKHQSTAQKLLETRSKVRELEAALEGEQQRVKGLETAATQMGEEHQKATASVRQGLEQSQVELENVTARWREVERQYEALHREMLLTLEQRDEARKLLELERSERERLAKALQSHHRS